MKSCNRVRFLSYFSSFSTSPAHLAASKGLTEVLEVLVHHQGSLELRNNAGNLPIHEAALFQRLGKSDTSLIRLAIEGIFNNYIPVHLHLFETC